MNGRNDDGAVRFVIDPALTGSRSATSPPDVAPVPFDKRAGPVARDRSFEISGSVYSASPQGPQGSTPAPSPTPLAAPIPSEAKVTRNAVVTGNAAARMRQSRARRRDGFRCFMIELHQSEIDALVDRGLLHPDQRNDCDSIVDALYDLLEKEL
jgi:hypothetical protein